MPVVVSLNMIIRSVLSSSPRSRRREVKSSKISDCSARGKIARRKIDSSANLEFKPPVSHANVMAADGNAQSTRHIRLAS